MSSVSVVSGMVPPETAGTGALERLAGLQQRPVQVETDVGLQTLRKALQHAVHVDPVRVRPRMLSKQWGCYHLLFALIMVAFSLSMVDR